MEVIEDTLQAKIQKIDSGKRIDNAKSYIATIEKIYSDRNTCDVLTVVGSLQKNISIKTRAGIVDGEVYGEIDLPEVGDTVFVQFLSGKESLAYIDGTIIPFLNSKFTGSAVNSSSKQFTKKLLVANKPKTYRRVFKSGTTLEISEDGTVIWETPSGEWLRISDSGGEIHLSGDTKSLVTHTELNTALQSMVSWINTHVHPTAATGSPSVPTPPALSLDISGAEATKVKTS